MSKNEKKNNKVIEQMLQIYLRHYKKYIYNVI